MRKTDRPLVICHMAPSIDGKIIVADWPGRRQLTAEYERTADTFAADAWMIGRISMEPYAGKARVPRRALKRRIPRTDFIADAEAGSYAIAIDPSGKLRWTSNAIDGSFLAAGLIDELSVPIAPVADGGIGTPTLFDAKVGKGLARRLRLISIERLDGDIVWLRYALSPSRSAA
jgi:riboflavin biosynthesis pyrimidine reductase